MHNIIDEKFWLAIAFLAFVLLILKYVWPILSNIIGDKSEQIAKDLKDAKDAKEKAEALLVQIKDQHKKAIENSEKIVKDAKKEAEKLINDSKKSVEKEVKRKVEALNDRIKNEEQRAIRDIKLKVVESAIGVVKEGLTNTDKEKFENVVKKSIDDVSKVIH